MVDVPIAIVINAVSRDFRSTGIHIEVRIVAIITIHTSFFRTDIVKIGVPDAIIDMSVTVPISPIADRKWITILIVACEVGDFEITREAVRIGVIAICAARF